MEYGSIRGIFHYASFHFEFGIYEVISHKYTCEISHVGISHVDLDSHKEFRMWNITCDLISYEFTYEISYWFTCSKFTGVKSL